MKSGRLIKYNLKNIFRIMKSSQVIEYDLRIYLKIMQKMRQWGLVPHNFLFFEKDLYEAKTSAQYFSFNRVSIISLV